MFHTFETIHGAKVAINSQHIVSISGPNGDTSTLTLDVFVYDPAIDGQSYRRIEVIGTLAAERADLLIKYAPPPHELRQMR